MLSVPFLLHGIQGIRIMKIKVLAVAAGLAESAGAAADCMPAK